MSLSEKLISILANMHVATLDALAPGNQPPHRVDQMETVDA